MKFRYGDAESIVGSTEELIPPHKLGSCRSTIELHPRLVALNILPERSPALRLSFGRSALEMVAGPFHPDSPNRFSPIELNPRPVTWRVARVLA
jgi:hypothetical protein